VREEYAGGDFSVAIHGWFKPEAHATERGRGEPMQILKARSSGSTALLGLESQLSPDHRVPL